MAAEFPSGGGGGGSPSGPAGGDLTGTYPNPTLAAGVIVNADVNAAAAIAESKLALASDAAAGTASRRTLGTGAQQAAAGNHLHTGVYDPAGTAAGLVAAHEADTTAVHGIPDTSLLATTAGVASAVAAHEADTTNVHGIADTSALATTSAVTTAISNHEADTTNVHGIPNTASLVIDGDAAGGSLAGTYPNPSIAAGAVGGTEIAAAIKDPAAATAGLRTLGTGAQQATAGNDARLSDARTPTGGASGDLTGTYPGPTIAAEAVTDAKIAAANKDGAAGTPSMRTLGTGAAQAAAGNHTHAGADITSGTVDRARLPTLAGVLHNLSASTFPTMGDDSGDGYGVGSVWIDTTADQIYQCVDATVGAAIWFPLAPTIYGGWITQKWYVSGWGALGTQPMNLDREYAVPLWSPYRTTLDRIGLALSTAGGAGSVVRLGIRYDRGDCYPDDLILDAGTIDGTLTTAQAITISQAIPAGLIWLTATAQVGTAPTVRSLSGHMQFVPTASNPTSNAVTCVAQAGVSGALPGTFGTQVAAGDAGPRVSVRVL